MIRHISLLLVVLLSGCASISTWDEVGRSYVQIADLKVEPASDGSNVVLKVIGEKDIPLVPFLCKIKSSVSQINTFLNGRRSKYRNFIITVTAACYGLGIITLRRINIAESRTGSHNAYQYQRQFIANGI